ncbi:MAG: dTDP-4-amino-4,6-dideoxygalactose transaminase [Bacteroidia bacterium]
MIPYNQPYITGLEKKYLKEAISSKKLSGNGSFTKRCEQFFEKKYRFNKTILTSSCTDALEMTAILLNIKPKDEVIIPSYTYVSTANAFVLRGAQLVFADSSKENPNIDTNKIEALITKKTKAIVPVHYAGVACNMDAILSLAKKYNLYVVEDAAQAIGSLYKAQQLGSIGDLATISFHETKNIMCGEGGLLVINNPKFTHRADTIRNKGTNRVDFENGKVNKYQWTDIGSSFSANELSASFLYAQLQHIDAIQQKRKTQWHTYYNELTCLEKEGKAYLPKIPPYANHNSHIFYLICKNFKERAALITHLHKNGVNAVFHNQSLHKSIYYADKHDGRTLPNADRYTNCLLRLPLFYELTTDMQNKVIENVLFFYK